MSDQPPNSFTFFDFLAVWGAVVATFAIAWNVVRDLGDKAKLQVTASIGLLTAPEGMPECMIMYITNVGKRAITVVSWGGQLTKNKKKYNFFPIHDTSLGGSTLPKKLDTGEQATLITTNFREIATPMLDNMYIADSTGKKWYISEGNLKELRQFSVPGED